MDNFEYYLPTRFTFGRGAEDKAGEMIKNLGGSNVLVHFGGSSAVKSGLISRVEASLQKAGLSFTELGGVKPNPRDTLIYEGIKLVREKKIDFILAVGGGSAIDSAKAIGSGSLYDGDFWDFFCGKAKPEKTLPVGAILTIAAAGSESSNSCVIMQEKTKIKRGLNVELQRPVFALMNPELTYTLPPYQTASGATDIMAHILERYFTNSKDVDVTDRLCEGLLLSVIRAAKASIKDPCDYEARAALMWASTLAHNNTVGVGRVGDWASHQIEHELSGMYDVAHGAGLAVVLPAWMRYTLSHDPNRFAQLATRVWGCEMDFDHPERTGLDGIERFEDFLRSIGMPITLKELGCDPKDIPYLAEHTKRPNNGKVGFFVPLDTQEIIDVLNIANK